MDLPDFFEVHPIDSSTKSGLTAFALSLTDYDNVVENIHCFNNLLKSNPTHSKNVIIYPLEIEKQ
jgi:hypothetical protein